MDNILKLVVGVVAVIGLIVLMIPEGDPLSSKGAAAEGKLPPSADEGEDEAVPPKNVPPDPVGTAPQEQITNFGQPMFDPTPPGQKALEQQQQQAQQAQAQASNQSTANDPTIGGAPAPAAGADAPLTSPYPGQQ